MLWATAGTYVMSPSMLSCSKEYRRECVWSYLVIRISWVDYVYWKKRKCGPLTSPQFESSGFRWKLLAVLWGLDAQRLVEFHQLILMSSQSLIVLVRFEIITSVERSFALINSDFNISSSQAPLYASYVCLSVSLVLTGMTERSSG